MRYLLQQPDSINPAHPPPLWVVLHGGFALAEQAVEMFGREAHEQNAFLLAPQATRPCGEGFCWSFAADAMEIRALLADVTRQHTVDAGRLSVVGYSMGCTMGLWLLAENPGLFSCFAALGMGSAFEPWEHDDSGVNEEGLRLASATTRVLLAGDLNDPAGGAAYFEDNLSRLRRAGFPVQTFRPNQGTHAVTDEMKTETVRFLKNSSMAATHHTD